MLGDPSCPASGTRVVSPGFKGYTRSVESAVCQALSEASGHPASLAAQRLMDGYRRQMVSS